MELMNQLVIVLSVGGCFIKSQVEETLRTPKSSKRFGSFKYVSTMKVLSSAEYLTILHRVSKLVTNLGLFHLLLTNLLKASWMFKISSFF